jgi:hypothetical protein
MGRKNHNHTKGKNAGRKYRHRDTYEAVDPEAVRYLINEDARVFGRATAKSVDNFLPF